MDFEENGDMQDDYDGWGEEEEQPYE